MPIKDKDGNTVYGIEPFEDCNQCEGKGCVRCPMEKEMAEARTPTPIFSCDINDEEGMQRLKNVIGVDALDRTFEDKTFEEGSRHLTANLTMAGIIQMLNEPKKEQNE